MRALIGNTYPIRDVIKQKGGKWDASCKLWRVPETVYDELKKMIPRKEYNYYSSKSVGKHECPDCCEDVYSGTQCWETGLTH